MIGHQQGLVNPEVFLMIFAGIALFITLMAGLCYTLYLVNCIQRVKRKIESVRRHSMHPNGMSGKRPSRRMSNRMKIGTGFYTEGPHWQPSASVDKILTDQLTIHQVVNISHNQIMQENNTTNESSSNGGENSHIVGSISADLCQEAGLCIDNTASYDIDESGHDDFFSALASDSYCFI